MSSSRKNQLKVEEDGADGSFNFVFSLFKHQYHSSNMFISAVKAELSVLVSKMHIIFEVMRWFSVFVLRRC